LGHQQQAAEASPAALLVAQGVAVDVQRLERLSNILAAGAIFRIEHNPSAGAAGRIGCDHKIGASLAAQRETWASRVVEPSVERWVELDPQVRAVWAFGIEPDTLSGRAEVEEVFGTS
jgi:hypothetical protein